MGVVINNRGDDPVQLASPVRPNVRMVLMAHSVVLKEDALRPISYRPGVSQCVGNTICRICGLEGSHGAAYTALFERRTLYKNHPGVGANRVNFTASGARAKATIHIDRLQGREMIVMGSVCRQAFGLRGVPPMHWMHHRGVMLSWIPTPTGTNRWWNDLDNKRDGSMFLRAAVQRAVMLKARC